MSQYPIFEDGDVVVVAPTGSQWRLHSAILSQLSPLFHELLKKDSNTPVPKKQRANPKHPILYKLNMIIVDTAGRWVDFQPVDLSIKEPFVLPENTNGKGAKPGYLSAYDNIFRCFYALDPILSDPSDEEEALFTHRSVHLIQAAERIQASRPVRRAIESYLLGLGPILWKHVVAYPQCYADLAIRLESPMIFKEAMVHVIGAWGLPGGMSEMGVSQVEGNSSIVQAIAERKVAELDEIKKKVESNLIDFIPPYLKKQVSNNGKIPGCAKYSGDIYNWQAFVLVRHYITKALCNKEGRLAKDGGAAFYRKLNEGGAAYLLPTDIQDWHVSFPMTSKGMLKFEMAVKLMKEQYQHLTSELLVNSGLPFPADADPLPYLTVGAVSEKDFPWSEEGDQAEQSDPFGIESNFLRVGPFDMFKAPVRSGQSQEAGPPRSQSVSAPNFSQLPAHPGGSHNTGSDHILTAEMHHLSTNSAQTQATTASRGLAFETAHALPSNSTSRGLKRSATEAHEVETPED